MDADLLGPLLQPLRFDRDRVDSIVRAMLEHPPRAVRVRMDRASRELPFDAEQVPWWHRGFWVADGTVRPSQFPNYAAADYYIQDAGSMLPLSLLEIAPADMVCDLCAAPGGKASAIAESLGEGGWLLANEPIRSRVELLEWALMRSGSPRWAVSHRDPEDLAGNYPEFFDAILVDAPCSGQTLLGRGKRSENAFAIQQIEHSAMRQKRILEAAIRMLKPKGRLVYSTCTFAAEENESQMAWLMEQHPGAWEPIVLPDLAKWASPLQPGCYRLWPDTDRCAGSFAAGLRLVGELDLPPTVSRNKTNTKGDRKPRGKQQSKIDFASLNQLGSLRKIMPQLRSEHLVSIPEDLKRLSELDVRFPSIGEVSHSGILPHHSLALLADFLHPATSFFEPSRRVTLDENQVAAYVRGEAIPRLSPEDGWCVATWNDRPLGWLKQSGNRCNNHLPKIGRVES